MSHRDPTAYAHHMPDRAKETAESKKKSSHARNDFRRYIYNRETACPA